MKRDVRVSGRITTANKEFLKKHKVSVGDAIAKYCEMMTTEKEELRSKLIDLKKEEAAKKREMFLLEMEIDEVNENLKRVNHGEVKSVENECIEEIASILTNKGFCRNNQDQNIFKNVDVLNIMCNYSVKYNIDMQTLKTKAIEYILEE